MSSSGSSNSGGTTDSVTTNGGTTETPGTGGSSAAGATGADTSSGGNSSPDASPGGANSTGGNASGAMPSSGASSAGGRSSATGGAGGSSTSLSHSVLGSVQKGPFIRGTTLTLQELDDSLSPTGRSFTFETNDDLGHFILPENVNSRYVEVIANGYYFDELANQLSNSQLTLRTISDISTSSVVNANLLTSLAAARERNLVAAGHNFQSARIQAEQEVLNALSFGDAPTSNFDQMDITHTGDTNGLLLAASLLLERLAYMRGAISPVAQLSQLIANVTADIAPDGSFDDMTTAATLRCLVPTQVDKTAVRSNLQARFDSLGTTGVVPAFEQYLVVPDTCCAAESRKCSGGAPQICNDIGQWTTLTACSGSTPNCKEGRCESPCSGNSKRCLGEVAQVCDASGLWQDSGQCTWGQPVQIDSSLSYMPTSVEVDDAGNVFALWLLYDSTQDGRTVLRTARYVPNSGWTTPITIDRSGGGDVLDAAIAVDPLGKATAIWTQRDSTPSSQDIPTGLWSRQYDPISAWQVDPTLIDVQPTYGMPIDALLPELTLLGNNPIATWSQYLAPDYVRAPRVSMMDVNSGWSAPHNLDQIGKYSGSPSVAANAAGGAFIVWPQGNGSESFVAASKYSNSTVWSAPITISKKEEELWVADLAVAVDANGNAIAIWSSVRSTASSVDANLYRLGVGWGESVTISSTRGSDLSLKFDSEGNALAVWAGDDGGGSRVMANRYVRGRGWGNAVSIQMSNRNGAAPRLVVDTFGHATAVWIEYQSINDSSGQIWINRFTPGLGWALPEVLRPETHLTYGDSTFLTVDAIGRLTLVWGEYDYVHDTSPLWALRFE